MKELLLAAVALTTLTTESGAVWFKIVHDLEPSQGALDAIAKPPNGSCRGDGRAPEAFVCAAATVGTKKIPASRAMIGSQ
jgi:hypothetical protein